MGKELSAGKNMSTDKELFTHKELSCCQNEGKSNNRLVSEYIVSLVDGAVIEVLLVLIHRFSTNMKGQVSWLKNVHR